MDISPLNVLIIEDEPGHAAAILRAFKILRPQDTVQSVGSLKEGRDAIAAAAPDVVVTDIQLPDGEAFELLNSPDIAGNFPVIVMTSYGNEAVAVEAIKSGAIEYVVKSPAAFNEMPRTVERVMREWAHVQEVQKARDALAHSQAELRSVFDGTPVMLCVIDSDRRVLTANRAFNDFVSGVSQAVPQERPCGILGCIRALDDPAGCGCGPRCGECSLRIAMADTLSSATPHIDVECEIPIRCNGVERNVVFLGSITPMPFENGCVRALVSLLDITERRQAEKKLRESESLLSRSQQVAHIGSWQVDVTTHQLLWSDELYRIFELSPQEYSADYDLFRGIVHPDDLARGEAAYDVFFRGDIDTFEFEHRIIRKDTGEIRYVYQRCLNERDADGTVIRSTGMVQDITERKQAEEIAAEHLRELEQWYRVTLNREDRVLELKAEINKLLERFGEQPKYGKDD